MKKFLALLLAAVMTMSLLTACGSSEEAQADAAETTEAADTAEEAAPAEDTTEEAAPAEETTAEAAASEALADGVLTVGTNA